jgi:hypothetical protein
MPTSEQVQYFADVLALARSYTVSNPSTVDCVRVAATESSLERSTFFDFLAAFGGREALLLQLAGAMSVVAP